MRSKPIHSNPAKTEKKPLLEHKGQPCRNMFLQAHALSKVHDLIWTVRMILPRAHLWKPCYNFSFQCNIQNLTTVSNSLDHWHWHWRLHGNPRARNSASGLRSTQQRRTRLLPFSPAVASHYLSGRLRPSAASAFRCPCLPLSQWEAQTFRCFRVPLPLPPTISVGGSDLPLLPPSAALASHYLSGRLRPSAASAFRCPCLPLSQWEAQTFRCFRVPLPLPPTISVGGSDLPLLPPSAALASHYLSGRLRPSAASAFRCPCLPLSQWEAQTFRCFRVPLPLPPTISVGGSGSFRLRALVTLVQWALKCQELDSANGSE